MVNIQHNLSQLPLTPVVVDGSVRRHSGWFTLGKCRCNYVYGNAAHQQFSPTEYTHFLFVLQSKLCRAAGLPLNTFNSCFVTAYDANQKLTWHSDNEPLFCVDDMLVLSWSFGATRSFGIRQTGGGVYKKIKLCPGDLLLMGGAMQKFYQHCVFPGDQGDDMRFNVTFRCVVQHEEHCKAS